MRFIKQSLLSVVCFYYCMLTPGTDGGKGNTENLLWEIITVSIIQAFIAAGLFYFFDWPTTMFPWIVGEGFLGLLGTVGLVAGLWTLVGGLAYPSLDSMIKANKEAARRKSSKAAMTSTAQKALRIQKENNAWDILKERDPEACRKLISDAIALRVAGREDEIQFEILKNWEFLASEGDQLKSKK